MPEVREYLRSDGFSPFRASFEGLRDPTAKARIDSTIRKLGRGVKPDVKSMGEGVHEARIDYGPGYRVYFANDGAVLIVLLLCGDKGTQNDDFAKAKRDWADYRARKSSTPTPTPTQPPPLLWP